MFEEMILEGFVVNWVVYNFFIYGLGRIGWVDVVGKLFREMVFKGL